MKKVIRKKIRLDAKRNNVDAVDLDYAIRSLNYEETKQNIEARIYADLVQDKSTHIWEVARETKKSIQELRKVEKK